MSNKTAAASFPIFGILGLIFITLKLAGIGAVASWSWWWVLSPFWGCLVLTVLIFLVIVIGAVVVHTLKR